MRVAVQMDPLPSLAIGGDSTFALMLSAQERGHEVNYYDVRDLSWKDGRVTAWAAPAKQPLVKPAETLDLSAHRRRYRHYHNDRAAAQMFGIVLGTRRLAHVVGRDAARSILAADKGGVFALGGSMCEPATHSRWAEAIGRSTVRRPPSRCRPPKPGQHLRATRTSILQGD